MSAPTQHQAGLRLIGLAGLPEVKPGDDLPALIGDAIDASGAGLETGDLLVVTQKIVSKAEGRLVHLPEIEPSSLARRLSATSRSRRSSSSAISPT